MLKDRLEPAQYTAARVVGLMYLITIITANFAEFYARGQLNFFVDVDEAGSGHQLDQVDDAHKTAVYATPRSTKRVRQ